MGKAEGFLDLEAGSKAPIEIAESRVRPSVTEEGTNAVAKILVGTEGSGFHLGQQVGFLVERPGQPVIPLADASLACPHRVFRFDC